MMIIRNYLCMVKIWNLRHQKKKKKKCCNYPKIWTVVLHLFDASRRCRHNGKQCRCMIIIIFSPLHPRVEKLVADPKKLVMQIFCFKTCLHPLYPPISRKWMIWSLSENLKCSWQPLWTWFHAFAGTSVYRCLFCWLCILNALFF